MVLDSLGSETPNIKDLVVEDTREELPFPDNYIAKGMSEIQDRLEGYKTAGAWSSFITEVGILKMVAPDNFKDSTINDSDWEKIFAELRTARFTRDQMEFLLLAMMIKVVSPEKAEDVIISKVVWRNILYSINKLKRDNQWDGYLIGLLGLKIISSEYFLNFEVTKEDWNKIIEHLNSYRTDNNWEEFINNLAILRFVSQENFQQVGLNTEDWQEIRSKIESKPSLAIMTRVLVAQDVELNEEGVKVTMPFQEVKSSLPPVPETRSF